MGARAQVITDLYASFAAAMAGALVLASVLRHTLFTTLDDSARQRARDVATLIDTGNLPDSIPAAGGTVLKAAEHTEWGGYSGYFADLDGHVWEIAVNPAWTVNEDGTLTI